MIGTQLPGAANGADRISAFRDGPDVPIEHGRAVRTPD